MTKLTRREKGVTLIELLVAVAITVVVGGSIIGAMYSGRSAFDSGRAIVYKHETARAALDMISRDLESAYVFRAAGPPYPEFYLGEYGSGASFRYASPPGDAEVLQFTALLDADDERHELRLVGYWLNERNEIIRYAEKLREHAEFPRPEPHLLVNDVAGLSFRFQALYKPDPNDENTWYLDWEDEWDYWGAGAHEYEQLPRAARISITATDSAGGRAEEFSTMVYIPLSRREF